MARVIFARVKEEKSALHRWLLEGAEEVCRRRSRLVILVRDSAMAARVDEQLWSEDEGAFLPHGVESTGLSGLTSVLIRVGVEIPAGAEVAINLSDKAAEWPTGWSGTVCDLIWMVSTQQTLEGRAKWVSYKARPDAAVEVKQDLDFSLIGVE